LKNGHIKTNGNAFGTIVVGKHFNLIMVNYIGGKVNDEKKLKKSEKKT
jgi:hypothetical protein